MLKKFFLFLFFIIFFISCLSELNSDRNETETHANVQLNEIKNGFPLEFIKEIEYNVAGYKYKEPETLKFKLMKLIYKISGEKAYWIAFKNEKIYEEHEIYVIERNGSNYIVSGRTIGRILKPSEEYFEGKKIFVYNSEGRLIRAEFEREGYREIVEKENELRKYELLASSFFSYWMLNLHEKFKLNELNVDIEVIGIKNYMNRSVFEVKIKSENLEKILLIDKKTKLLLKEEYIPEQQNIRYNRAIVKMK